LIGSGFECGFLNAYPPRYFEAIDSGRRMYSAIPLAAIKAGIQLKNYSDLKYGTALSADFTAKGWRDQLNLMDAPQLTDTKAGEQLGKISKAHDFALFEYWLSDYAGHHQDMSQATELLNSFDQVLGGLLNTWGDDKSLIILTSDHGNIEDLSTRRHTTNPVPALLIGDSKVRQYFIDLMYSAAGSKRTLDLSCIAPAIFNFLADDESYR
jgi:predicted AlkP superfamily pyrophosphatase or phosphodiesterase